jgi:carboxylesterase
MAWCHLAGVCLGALVALEVARLENHQDKLALYAPPLFLDGWSLPRLTWLRPLGYILPGMARRMRIPEAEPFGIKNPRIRKLIQQRFERGERFHYPMSRLACIREVDKLRRQLMPRLGQITCPTLIVHADEDDITSPRSAHHLQKHLGGPVDFMPLSDSYHMILVDNERMAVLARSVDFFQARPAPQGHQPRYRQPVAGRRRHRLNPPAHPDGAATPSRGGPVGGPSSSASSFATKSGALSPTVTKPAQRWHTGRTLAAQYCMLALAHCVACRRPCRRHPRACDKSLALYL